MNDDIKKTVERNLCISCGICAGICPKRCIELEKTNNQYIPYINDKKCTSCGICADICPVNQIAEYDESNNNIIDYLLGNYKDILYAKTKDKKLLSEATSGGFITQMVYTLLEKGAYKSAFVVEGYNYDSQLQVKKFSYGDNLCKTTKSRYLTVSYENMIRYILKHPTEKSIIVATGCCCQGIINVIRKRKLHRENYLLIGLFCDKTMNYGVVDFFRQHSCGKGNKLTNLFFRTKATGGWPGNVRLEYSDGAYKDLPNTERMKVKNYFMPERCLYCLDKLNRNSDISVGDNYIAGNKDKFGANSIIIRTDSGMRIWNKYKEKFEYKRDDLEEFIESQHLLDKKRNYCNARIKGLYKGKTKKPDIAYKCAIRKIQIGKKDDVYKRVNRSIFREKIRLKIRHVLERLFHI